MTAALAIKAPPAPFDPLSWSRQVRDSEFCTKVKALLWALGSRAKAHGRCHPSIACIQKDTGLSRNGVIRALKLAMGYTRQRVDEVDKWVLTGVAWIQKLPKIRIIGKGWVSNRYLLTPPEKPQLHVVVDDTNHTPDHIDTPVPLWHRCGEHLHSHTGATVAPKITKKNICKIEEEEVLGISCSPPENCISSSFSQNNSNSPDTPPSIPKTKPSEFNSDASDSNLSPPHKKEEEMNGGCYPAVPKREWWLLGPKSEHLECSDRCNKHHLVRVLHEVRWLDSVKSLTESQRNLCNLVWHYVPKTVLDWAKDIAKDRSLKHPPGTRTYHLRRIFRFKLHDWAKGDDGPDIDRSVSEEVRNEPLPHYWRQQSEPEPSIESLLGMEET